MKPSSYPAIGPKRILHILPLAVLLMALLLSTQTLIAKHHKKYQSFLTVFFNDLLSPIIFNLVSILYTVVLCHRAPFLNVDIFSLFSSKAIFLVLHIPSEFSLRRSGFSFLANSNA